MKNKLLLLLCVFLAGVARSQTTVVIKPDSAHAYNAQVIDYPGLLNSNYGNYTVMAAHIWTNGSTTWHMRSFIKFDLSAIPANAVILSATLDLYADDPTTTFSGNPSTPMNGSNNACTVRRITQPWNVSTITWNNQPSDTSINQAILPTSVNTSQDYLGTDVRAMVQDMLQYGNYGFKITPVATTPSNSMIFRTSTNADTASRPVLTVVYTLDSVYADLGPDKNACAGSTVVLNAVNGGGYPPFSYSWTAIGDTLSCTNCKTPSATITQNSTFICTITDSHNSVSTDTVNYTLSGGVNQLQASFVNSNISCSQPIDTTIATVTGGVLPLTYQWGDGFSSNGGDNEMHYYLQSGSYIVEITDSTGCSISVLNNITNSTVGVSLAQAVKPICAEDTTGSISLTVTGGTPPYQYHWVTGQNTSSLTNITAGSYSVTVTDNNGCSSLFYHNLMPDNDAWGYYVYLDPTNANCGNNGSVEATVANGVAPYSYAWNTGATTPIINNLGAGNYSLVVTDSTGCARHANAIVQASCISYITGHVFIDTNANCALEAGETGIQYIGVRAKKNNHTYYGYTQYDGSYVIAVPDTGTYHLTVNGSNLVCGTFSFCGDTSQNVDVSVLGGTVAGNNFSATVAPGYDLDLYLGWTNANPGFTKTYWFEPFNNATTPFSGAATLTFSYDPRLIYLYSLDQIPVHDSINHTLTWTFSNIQSSLGWWWWWNYYGPTSYFHVPLTTLSVGDTLHSSYILTPTSGDCNTANNSDSFSELVTGSFDPNEKQVSPERSISPEDSVLTYTIHFQNTGTDSTWFIILRDTLSPLLDAATVENIASSHPFTEFSVSGEGALKWVFNPLRLVDSVTNPSGSKGFVMFRVKKNVNAPVGAIINNKASIYFDYNEPVVTNTVADTVMNPFLVNINAVGTTCGNNNGSATAAAFGGVPPYTYVWNNSNNTGSVTNVTPGTYAVTVTDAFGNTFTASETVTASTGITNANITADQTSFCGTDSANICAPAGYASYQWNNGAANACIYTAASGNYYVTITDANNCTAESNHLAISVFPAATVSTSVFGDTLLAFGASSYQWYFNGNIIPGATNSSYIATQSGNYSVAIVDANGCTAVSNAIQITTGINETGIGFIRVFPNPINDGNWNLEVDQSWIGSTITIYDESGRLLQSFTITQNTTPIASMQTSGVYLAKVVSKQHCYSTRLIKL